MPIHIYNSLTRAKEEFKPLKAGHADIYACGPTVYDVAHIGHARSAYIFDCIRSYLILRGYKVKLVRNVTDVDDKIIDKAIKEFPQEDLNSAFKKVAEKNLDLFHKDMLSLGIGEPDFEPKASEYIGKMIIFIQQLIEKGVAYQAGSDVYFDITIAKEYGKLSNQSLDKMEVGTRVSPGENKKGPLDFALWKAAKENEPSWDSPWGKGRPGWHIECSVMSSDILGDEFDIHGGGIDLIFPHHENEIAQSEGLGKKFARCWIHHGLLTINAQKMAKSLGNFVTIKDFLARYKDPDILKMFFLSAHYSHPIDYNEEKIGETKAALERIMILSDKMVASHKLSLDSPAEGGRARDSLRSQAAGKSIKEIEELKNKFIAAMDDDFNTPQAMAAIFDLVNATNKNIENQEFMACAHATLKELLGVFGITLVKQQSNAGISHDEVGVKVKQREQARRDKNFALSDTIRKELEAQGVILEDTKSGTTWRRKL